MAERRSGRNRNRLISHIQVHPRGLGDNQRLCVSRQVHRGEIVGEHFEHRRRPKLTRMQNPATQRSQQGQNALKGSSIAACEDGDIARISPMTTT